MAILRRTVMASPSHVPARSTVASFLAYTVEKRSEAPEPVRARARSRRAARVRTTRGHRAMVPMLTLSIRLGDTAIMPAP